MRGLSNYCKLDSHFDELLATVRTDFEYYDRKTDFFSNLLDRLGPMEELLPDDERVIGHFYATFETAYQKYTSASVARDQLESYLLKLERLRDSVLFLYEY